MLRTINRGPEQHKRNTKELNFTKRRGAASQEEDIFKSRYLQIHSGDLGDASRMGGCQSQESSNRVPPLLT